MKYIDAEKLIAEIERRIQRCEDCERDGYPDTTSSEATLKSIRTIVTSLQQEQPDNEDIDKVAQELYEHLYELKRRNNVPTNLYDKQEIINLWKAGIEYGRNHPKQDQPEVDLVAELKHHLATTPKEQLEKEWKELEPWNNIGPTVQEFLCGKQPEVDLEKEIVLEWKKCEPTDEGMGLETANIVNEQFDYIARHFYGLRNRALEKAARNVYESWMGGTMDDVRRDMFELDKVLNARKEE